MILKYKIVVLFYLITTAGINSQNTIGTINNTENAYDGYALFTFQKETYLINNCGQVINQWTSLYNSGKSVYVLENGNLLRASSGPNPGNIAIPGIGGRIELFDWDGNVLWDYVYSNTNASQHHDIYPMPNGNVLVLAASILTDTEAIQMGRKPENLEDNQLYNEHILEIKQTGTDTADVIWRWDFKDHLIQDYDATKSNFGIVQDNHQLMDINFLGESNGSANWMHINSVQYNESLDQIILSSKKLSEIYIIDHSTTTAEAQTNSGGTYGKGGDLLYRWGNPISYKQGTTADQKLFGQHYPHWIAEGALDAGKIILFNNGVHRANPYSEINIINPPTSGPGIYNKDINEFFGPLNPDYVYGSPNNTDFYSPILSSAQVLPNNNILSCEGTSGRFFEIDSNDTIVWEYINPVSANGILTQGEAAQTNNVFRVKKYGLDYAAFTGRDLSPKPPIEKEYDLSNCNSLSVPQNSIQTLAIYPNPVKDILYISGSDLINKIEVYTNYGSKVKVSLNKNTLDMSSLSAGIYQIRIFYSEKITYSKIIKL